MVLLLPYFQKMQVMADYAFDYKKYATELCINRDNPMLNCNGKCQLAQALNSDKTEHPNAPLEKITEIIFTIVNHIINDNIVYKLAKKHGQFYYQNNYDYLTTNKVFHPPIG